MMFAALLQKDGGGSVLRVKIGNFLKIRSGNHVSIWTAVQGVSDLKESDHAFLLNFNNGRKDSIGRLIMIYREDVMKVILMH